MGVLETGNLKTTNHLFNPPLHSLGTLDLELWSARRDSVAAGWGRTGFDLGDTPEAACRGWFVGLVNHRTKKQLLTKN